MEHITYKKIFQYLYENYLSSKKLNKEFFEIIKNFEIWCFVDLKNINNYSKYIKRYKDNFNCKKTQNLTNNIVESMHEKLNYFLPKKNIS